MSEFGPKPFFGDAHEAPVQGNANNVHCLAIDRSGLIRFVTTALALTEPRFDQTRTQPPFCDTLLLREFFRDLDEEFGLKDRVNQRVLRPEVEVFREPVACCRIGEFLGIGKDFRDRP